MAAPITRYPLLGCLFILFLISRSYSYRKYTSDDLKRYRVRVERMFQHAYNGYLHYAYPYDELRPLSCDGQDTWGSYSLTLVDALDTLAVMGNFTEFQRVADLLTHTLDFDRDINVSVFETNIRVVGGLLSAHLLSMRAGVILEPGWPCSGPLLRLAEDVARRLLPAFNTSTGMPFGTVNLRHGIPKGETPVTCTAGVGTFIVEFGALTRLTGDPRFERVALRALQSLWETRSELDLVGNHIDVTTGKWTAVDSGIGAGVDSYFEYLVKGSILFQHPQLMEWFHVYSSSIEKYLKREDWYMWAHMKKGTITLPIFQSLEAFWPGVQSLIGNVDKAMKTLHNYHQVWRQYGFTPEFYNIPKSEAHSNRDSYPLRPELIESTMYLYRATHDPYLIEVGIDILESIEHSAKTSCGYATVRDVRTHQLENRMESFFLSETTKYLYLLFDEESFIHNDGGQGIAINTTNGECIIDAGGYVFNTEAHPIDTAALYCCSAEKKVHDEVIQHFHDNVDLLTLLGLVDPKQDIFGSATRSHPKRKRRTSPPSALTGFEKLQKMTQVDISHLPSESMSHGDSLEGMIKLSVPPSVKQEKEPLEKDVKNFLKGVSLDPGSLNEVVDRILSTLNDAVQSARSTENLEQDDNDGVSISKPTPEPADKTTIQSQSAGEDEASQAEAGRGNAKSVKGPKIGENKLTRRYTPSEKMHSESQELDARLTSEENEEADEDEGLSGSEEEPVRNTEKLRLEDEDEYEDDGDMKARLFTCPAQPFYTRLSLMGEMFLDTL